ncbi:His-Xaa-Ser system-associated MauG-like protein [Pacificispira sp.]|uniref:His-Xaa-Ser system-associated MauG-like protein n=1 Tax=Pacificispira sp. TaxID=2888761 RepID=UPI003B51F066
MRLSVSVALLLAATLSFPASSQAELRPDLLRALAVKNGLTPPTAELPETKSSQVGGKLFASDLLSFNGDTSCQTCHLDAFSSADGLPVAIGVGGKGEGMSRLSSDGAVVPRNTLPLWGRGEPDFKLFFWDGKVDGRTGPIVSQFLENPPSDDLLTVAVHLPFVEIREMVVDTETVEQNLKAESVAAAEEVFKELIMRVRSDTELGQALADAHDIAVDELHFIHVAQSVAAFIRHRFQRRETPFQAFIFRNEPLPDDAVAGGLIFYGKGRCVLCHNGPHFSDFDFHAVAFPQASFGKNGFGVDYGRYNVTYDPADTYLFRTPPLTNVSNTGPYGHSGSLKSLEEAITAHFDPLRLFDVESLSDVERVELFKRLGRAAADPALIPILSEEDVGRLVVFLSALGFNDPMTID